MWPRLRPAGQSVRGPGSTVFNRLAGRLDHKNDSQITCPVMAFS